MSKSVHHYGYLKQNQGMNTKSQLVVQGKFSIEGQKSEGVSGLIIYT